MAATFKRKPGADLIADVEAIRVRIVAAQTKLDDVEHAPVSADEFRDRVAALVDGSIRAARAALDIDRFAARDFDPSKYDVNLPFAGEYKDRGFGAALQRNGLGLFAVMLGRDVVIDRLISSAAETGTSGVSSAERDAGIRQIHEELHALEVTEEEWVRQSEATAHPISRRPDARPEVVLAKDLAKVEIQR